MAVDIRPSTPAPTPPREEVGTFVTNVCVGYVEPPPEVVARIQQSLTETGSAALTPLLLSNLVTIKLLAPEESRELRIYPMPEITKVVGKVRKQLVKQYYAEQVRRGGQS